MATTRSLAPEYKSLPARITIVEASAGPARRRWLENYAKEMEPGAQRFVVACAFDSGGPWAGVNELFSALVPKLKMQRPDLMERHALELIYVLPRLRRSLTVRNPSLTDLAPREEKTRN